MVEETDPTKQMIPSDVTRELAEFLDRVRDGAFDGVESDAGMRALATHPMHTVADLQNLSWTLMTDVARGCVTPEAADKLEAEMDRILLDEEEPVSKRESVAAKIALAREAYIRVFGEEPPTPTRRSKGQSA